MATLKTIITEYINLLDKPFDIALYRRIRQLILNQRALEISKESERYGVSNKLIQYLNPSFEIVKPVDTIVIGTNEQLIRSTNKILRQAIDLTHDSPFYYVGSIDLSLPFMYVNNINVISRLRRVKHFNRTPLYYIIQGHIYAVVKKGTINLSVGHVWHDPGLIDLENDFIEDEYFDDEYEFLTSHDMLQIIKERLLKGELQIIPADVS